MFEYMGDRLSNAIKNIKKMGKITEDNINDAMKEIRMALLEADVNYKIVKEFVNTVQEKALGQDVLKSLTPGQQVIKIVRDEMTELLGGALSKINFTPNPPTVIMLVGLQGSRKNNYGWKAC